MQHKKSNNSKELLPPHPCTRFFGIQVKFYRNKAKLTQQTLADISGIKMRHIQKIEAGDVDVKLSTLAAISRALGISPSTLLYPTKTTAPLMCGPCIGRQELLVRPR